jgi:hypothetical protein
MGANCILRPPWLPRLTLDSFRGGFVGTSFGLQGARGQGYSGVSVTTIQFGVKSPYECVTMLDRFLRDGNPAALNTFMMRAPGAGFLMSVGHNLGFPPGGGLSANVGYMTDCFDRWQAPRSLAPYL